LEKLEEYIDKGENLLIAADTDTRLTLKPLLEKIGVNQKPGFLVQQDRNFGPDYIEGKFTDDVNHYLDKNKLKMVGNEALSLDRVIMNCATGLDYKQINGFIVRPIVVIDTANTWNTRMHKDITSGPLIYSPEKGDETPALSNCVSIDTYNKWKRAADCGGWRR
jgi:ABC-2 type transport system permease protein